MFSVKIIMKEILNWETVQSFKIEYDGIVSSWYQRRI